MSNLEQFFNRGQSSNVAMFFPSSGTYTIPYTGKYRLTTVGAGGSGASAQVLTTGGAASGGGGGAFCEKEVDLVAADVLTFVVGAGGTAVTGNTSDGVDGGESSIHGAGSAAAAALNMHVGPGLKGLFTVTNAQNKAGGTGGTASGGDINSTGGAGGAATHLTNGAEGGGGGSAGSPYRNGFAGGSAISSGAACSMAGGGGGIGGTGGLMTGVGLGGGGGTGGAASGATVGIGRLPVNQLSGFFGITKRTAVAFFESVVDPFRALYNEGSNSGTTSGPGSGTSAGAGVHLAGFLGGGGGSYSGASISCSPTTMGGGGGGLADAVDSTGKYSGAGGGGICCVERIG